MSAVSNDTVVEQDIEIKNIDTTIIIGDNNVSIDENGDEIANQYDADKLRQEQYTETLDPQKKIDERLKLGTSDDELVDQFVSTAKSGMGIAGNFIPDDAFKNSLK